MDEPLPSLPRTDAAPPAATGARGKDPALLARAIEHHQAGQLSAAEEIYRGLLAANPNHADALHLLGVLAKQQGRLDESVARIEAALRVTGEQPLLLFNLAGAHEERGNLAAASDCLARAIPRAIEPLKLDIHRRLAGVLRRAGHLEEALRQAREVVRLAPQDAAAYQELASLEQSLGQLDAAQASYERAIELDPKLADAWLGLAALCTRRRQHERARACYDGALRAAPDAPEVHNLLADWLVMEGQIATAREHYRRAIAIRPHNDLWRLRQELIGPLVFRDAAEIDAYRAQLTVRLQEFASQPFSFELDDLPTSACKPPLAWAYQGRDDLPLKRLLAGLFETLMPRIATKPRPGRPRVGFVVSGGSEGVFLRGMAGVLNHFTPGEIVPVVITAPSAIAACRKAITHPDAEYVPLAPTLNESAQRIAAAGCGLLYHWEAGTDSWNYFLPMLRLAPVQCASWGWPMTSGQAAVDYFLTSHLLDLPGAESQYSERLVRLANLPNYYSPLPELPPAAERTRFGVRAADHIYLCAQNPRKIQPDFDSLAAMILRSDPAGVLFLIEAPWPHVTQALHARLTALMPDCGDRIRWLPRMRSGDYLTMLGAADVLLDTVHYGGGANSTYDAFAMGTPVVTLPSVFHRGRYAAAAYQLIGLADCIATSPAHYAELGVRIASDPTERRRLSQAIAETRGGVFNKVAAVREIEGFFLSAISAQQPLTPGSSPSRGEGSR